MEVMRLQDKKRKPGPYAHVQSRFSMASQGASGPPSVRSEASTNISAPSAPRLSMAMPRYGQSVLEETRKVR